MESCSEPRCESNTSPFQHSITPATIPRKPHHNLPPPDSPMKYALIIPDGCADEPQEALGGKTPLQAANVPNMDAIAAAGIVGQADPVPASLTPGSDVGTMSLFGYDPLQYHTGRAPIEAAAQGIELGPDDWAIRCNLVTLVPGPELGNESVMESFTAHQIPNDEAAELIALLQKDQCGSEHWKFHAGVSYRNLLIYRARGAPAPFTKETRSTPPHDITDKPVAEYLPTGPGSELLRELMRRSEEVFSSVGRIANPPVTDAGAATEANGLTIRSTETAATGIWLWGLGRTPQLPAFRDRFGLEGAVITAVDLLRGLARLIGWQVVEVAGATGYLDTDYAAKGRAAIETLQSGTDLVVVHVEATDEASHEGDVTAKVEALERIDADIVGPVHEYLKSQGDYRILVSPDHPTLLRTKTHAHGLVPYALCGAGVSVGGVQSYDETVAASGGDAMPGFELMGLFCV